MSFYSVLPIIGFLASWIAPIILGSFLAKKKSLSKHWLWFGFHPMLAFLAYLIIALRKERKTCPQCFSHVDIRAHKCPKCTSDLEEKTEVAYKRKAHTIIAILLGLTMWLSFFLMTSPSEDNSPSTVFSDFNYVWTKIKVQEESSFQFDSGLKIEGGIKGETGPKGYKMIVDVIDKNGSGVLVWTASYNENKRHIDTILLIDGQTGDSLFIEPSNKDF